jgi:hypothetical protein
MGVKLVASSGGSVELVPTNTASNFTVTVPAKTGTMAMDGPAFSAYPSGNQTITTSTFTKLQYNTEEFDTNSNYDNATNYRFQPTVAGYYSFTAGAISLNVVTRVILAFYKNGTIFKAFDIAYALNSLSGASLIYLNGSTDYVELYAYMVGTTPTIANSSVYSFFQASMVRSA